MSGRDAILSVLSIGLCAIALGWGLGRLRVARGKWVSLAGTVLVRAGLAASFAAIGVAAVGSGSVVGIVLGVVAATASLWELAMAAMIVAAVSLNRNAG